MSSTSTMPFYRVNNMFNASATEAFRFVNQEKKHKKQSANYEERLKDIGGRLSPTWAILSMIGLLAAIGFSIFEAFNAQGAIAGIVDPMGNGTISSGVLMAIGVSIAIIGMIFGHLMQEGLTKGFDTDPHTGGKSLNSKFTYFIIGIIGAAIYIWYQYVLVKSAIKGAGIGKENGLSYMPYVVVGIATLELLVGALIINKAFSYLLLFATGLVQASTGRRINAAAKATNDNYRSYMNFLDAYNKENPSQPLEREGNGNIRRAIAHYSGIDLPQDNTTSNLSAQPVEVQTGSSSEQTTEIPSVNNRTLKQTEAAIAVENFMNDTTDQDLTA